MKAKIVKDIPAQVVGDKAVQIVCILDRSGSMSNLAPEVIGSFNEFVKDQQKLQGEAELTLVLFDDKYEIVYSNLSIQNVPELTKEIYYARGMTALYDAVGRTISNFEGKDVMVLIQTDGYENGSHEYNQYQLKELIKAKEAEGWDFIFLGANIDVKVEGDKMGLMSKSMAYTNDVAGMRSAFTAMSNVTADYRASKV